MFRKTGFKGRPSIVTPPEHDLEFYLEYCFTASKIATMFGVSSKTILRRMAEFGLYKKPYSMELNIFWINNKRWLIAASIHVAAQYSTVWLLSLTVTCPYKLSVFINRMMLNSLALIGMDQHQILSGMAMMFIWMIQLKLASQRLTFFL